MNIDTIINVIIGLFIYNMILKSIGVTILKAILKTDAGKESVKEFKEKLSFKDRLEEKIKEANK